MPVTLIMPPFFPEGKTAPDLQVFEFPSQDGATVGGQVAFQWISVQLIQKGDSITWSMNGIDVVKASQSDASYADEGNVFLGYSDWFASLSDNEFMSFGLFDNLKVPAGRNSHRSFDCHRSGCRRSFH